MRRATVRHRRAATGLLAGLALAGGIAPAPAQDRIAIGPSGVRLAVTVTDMATPAAALAAGRDLEVALAVIRPESGAAVEAAAPLAWVRRLAPGQPGCATAAYTTRATGVISPDDIPLARSYLLAVGNADGRSPQDHLRVVDLTHRLNAADQISVTPLGGRTAGLLVHPGKPRAFIARPDAGDVAAVDLPWGRFAVFAAGLDRPAAIAALGSGLVVAEGGARAGVVHLDADGRVIARAAVGAAPVDLIPAGPDRVLALAADGTGLLLSAGGAPVRLHGLGANLASGRDALLFAGGAGHAELRWLDDPATPQIMPLPFAADGFAFAADERFALAWSNARLQGVVIDLASGAAGGSFPLPDAVEEAAIAGPALVLTHRREPVASIVDLSPVPAGANAVVRRVRLPLPAAGSGDALQTGRLAGSREAGSAVTVRPGSDVAFILAAGGGLSDQPMSAITIRGDVPRRIARFDHQLLRTGPGRYTAPLRLQRGGRYEVVATTGPLGATACQPFHVDGPGAEERPQPALRLVGAPPRSGKTATLELAVADPPAHLSGPVRVRIDDLAYGWSRVFTAEISPEARLRIDVAFPAPGAYSVSLPAFAAGVMPLLVGVAE